MEFVPRTGSFLLARALALLYFINNIDDPEIVAKSRKQLIPETILFLVFFLTFLIRLLLVDGFAVNPDTGEVFMQPYKYFMNLIEMPIVVSRIIDWRGWRAIRHRENDILEDLEKRHLVRGSRDCLDRISFITLRRI